MSTVITEWAAVWGVPQAALADLVQRLTMADYAPAEAGRSEAAVQADIRLAAAKRGITLWRNNTGVLMNDAGVPVRFGLNNDSPAANKRMKSADLIGIHRPSGRFVSVEVKRPGWKHSDASERDRAQLAWAVTINACGGVALRATSAAALDNLEI